MFSDYNKNLFFENIIKISNRLTYFEILITKFYFDEKDSFKINNSDNLIRLYNHVLKINEKYEILKINEDLYVPVEKSTHKKIHSTHNPLKERISIEASDENLCYEIFGIGFLYSLHGLKTKKDYKSEFSIDNNNLLFNFSEKYETKGSKKFVLIDENLDLFLLSCLYQKVYEIFEDNDVNIYIKGIVKDEYIKLMLYESFKHYYNPLFIDKIITKKNLNCINIQALADLELEWNEFRKDIVFNLKSMAINFKLGFSNIVANLNTIIKNADLHKNISSNINKINGTNLIKILNKKFEKAIIIGASPTLDDGNVKSELNYIKNKKDTLILAVDNGIRYCINNDIIPDIIVILDSRNITKLMFNRNNNYLKNVPVFLPLSSARWTLNYFVNPFIFITSNFNKFFEYINLLITVNKQNFIENYSEQELMISLNLIKDILHHLPHISIPVKNIGSFSYLLLKNMGFAYIKSYGIDFSFTQKKYYYSDSYFYNFHRARQNYINTLQNISVKTCLQKGEKYLFEKYIQEFLELQKKEIICEIEEESNLNSFQIGEIIDEYNINLLSFYYMKYNNKEKTSFYFNQFIIKYLKLLFN